MKGCSGNSIEVEKRESLAFERLLSGDVWSRNAEPQTVTRPGSKLKIDRTLFGRAVLVTRLR